MIITPFVVPSIFDFYSKNRYTEISVGNIYTKWYKWENDSNNPFETPKVDTIKILDIKGNYVLWQFKDGFTLSSRIIDIQMSTKPIDPKQWSKIKFKPSYRKF